jgi:hypothetical protein
LQRGGVNQETAGNFILSGAEAIGVETELIPTEAIARRQSDRIKELARRFRRMVKEAREQIEVWQQSVVLKGVHGYGRVRKVNATYLGRVVHGESNAVDRLCDIGFAPNDAYAHLAPVHPLEAVKRLCDTGFALNGASDPTTEIRAFGPARKSPTKLLASSGLG